jgi:DNA invertase Pin-like site-specific DNA recombinase
MTRDQIKWVIGYIRVSTEDQAINGAGLEAQRQAIERKVAEKGWELLRLFEDKGVSGKRMAKQPALVEALAMLKSKKAHALVVSKMDRLSRSLTDFSQTLEEARDQGWHLVAIDLDIDTSTPGGEMAANGYINASQFERRMIGARTKEALAVRRARGIGVPGGLKGKMGPPKIVSAAVEKRIKQRRARGLSYQRIAAELDASGVPAPHTERWGWTTIRRVMERSKEA